jgi:hypothetical protein
LCLKEYRRFVLEAEEESDSKEERRLEEEDLRSMVKFTLKLELKYTLLRFIAGVESKHKPR